MSAVTYELVDCVAIVTIDQPEKPTRSVVGRGGQLNVPLSRSQSRLFGRSHIVARRPDSA